MVKRLLNLIGQIGRNIFRGSLVKTSTPTSHEPRNCYNTTLGEFIQAVVHDKWAYSVEEWQNVLDEYIELLRDDQKDKALSIQKDLARVSNKIVITQIILNVLDKTYNAELCAELRKMGYTIRYSEATLADDLQKTLTQAKSLVMQRNELQQRLAALHTDKKDLTEADFDNNLVHLSKFMQYRVSKDIPLSEYVSIRNAYDIHCEQLEKSLRNGQGIN